VGKIPNFDSFGDVFLHFSSHKREIWHEGADLRSSPPCQISGLSGQRVASGGQITIFGQLSKCNTSMAALRAGLPVMKTFFFCILDVYYINKLIMQAIFR